LVKDLDQIHLVLLTNFCLHFETERVQICEKKSAIKQI
jgi:hypothetical protein